MASSSSMWLPPLNSRYPCETNVYISQTDPGSKKRPNGSMFFLILDATVEFKSDDDENSKEPPLDTLYGLNVLNGIQIPMKEVSAERIALEVRNCTSLYRFNGDVTLSECYLGDSKYRAGLSLNESTELFEKILNFLCVSTEKSQNVGANSIEVGLSIQKEIIVPREELNSWHLWYEEKAKGDPLFEAEYQRAIGRPRTEEEQARAVVPDVEEKELLELQEVGFGDLGTKITCCCICFEEFLPDSKLRKLGCDHVFDCDCITKWLQHSNMCPLCRYNE